MEENWQRNGRGRTEKLTATGNSKCRGQKERVVLGKLHVNSRRPTTPPLYERVLHFFLRERAQRKGRTKAFKPTHSSGKWTGGM